MSSQLYLHPVLCFAPLGVLLVNLELKTCFQILDSACFLLCMFNVYAGITLISRLTGIFNDISKMYAQMLLLGGAETLHTIFTQIKCWIDSSMYLPCRVNRLNATTSAVSWIKYNHSWKIWDWPLWRLRFSESGAQANHMSTNEMCRRAKYCITFFWH